MLKMAGQSGQIRYGFYEAAAIGPWQLDAESDGRATIRARVVVANAYYLTQRPLCLVLSRANITWQWRDVAPSISGHTMSLSVALSEREKV